MSPHVLFRRIPHTTILAAVLLTLLHPDALPGQSSERATGSVAGVVTSELDSRPLAGATVRIEGSSRRALSGANGFFRLPGVPAGEHRLVVEYIGFRSATASVTVVAEETARASFTLEISPLAIEGAVAEGERWTSQAAALNRQRTAASIQNVVSAEQMERMPDPQVSDAIRRLPGVATFDHRGEPMNVFIRGMAPGMSNVTLDGDRLPTTGLADREVSLAGLPSDLLASLELSKAITPDMDADAVGGTVNLVTRQPMGDRGIFQGHLGGGLHQYADSPNATAGLTWGQRFGDLGILLRGSYRRNDRIMDDIRHFWGTRDFGNGEEDVLEQLRLGSYHTLRDRYAFTGRVDYQLGDQSAVYVRGLYNYFDKHGIRHQFRVRPENGTHLAPGIVEGARLEPIGRRNQITQTLSSITAGGETVIGALRTDASLTYGQGHHNQPYQEYLNFRVGGVDLNYDISDRWMANYTITNESPEMWDPGQIGFRRYENRTDDVLDRDWNARLNFELPYRLAEAQGAVRFGGRYFTKSKDRDYWVRRFPDIDGSFQLSEVAANGEYRNIVGNRYRIGHGVDWGLGGDFVERNRHLFGEDVDYTHEISDASNYRATETVGAGYLMSTLDWGPWMLLGGVRAEHTATSYVGNQTLFDPSGSYQSTTELDEGSDYLNLFPMAHLRYRMSENTNARMAITTALARPNFTDLAPFEFIDQEAGRVSRGNPDLRPSLVTNVDLLVEHYFEPLGLLSGGVFYKRLTDFFYSSVDRISGGELDGFEVRQPMNGATADLYGLEMAWQQRLAFLPGYLSGLGLNVNYTFTGSNAELRDVTREVPLPRQVPHVLNAALSYDLGGFNAMLTANHRSSYLWAVSQEAVNDHRSHLAPSMDRYLAAQTQFDLAASQHLGQGASIFLEINNITNTPQAWYDGHRDFHYRSSFNYAWGNLGMRYRH